MVDNKENYKSDLGVKVLTTHTHTHPPPPKLEHEIRDRKPWWQII